MKSSYQAEILICADCGEEFVFARSAQEYFAEKGFSWKPTRCKSCQHKHKERNGKNRSEVTARRDLDCSDNARCN
ncbi:MAG: zinc-ribbon domain-containing protein [candidate division Zixibacteria bacterium]|nr:zinc-ribbon domain-containing protein [candidate division Zixibacteria bacterium]